MTDKIDNKDLNTSIETSITSHLLELRVRLIYSIAAWIIATIICYNYVNEIMYWLTTPLAKAYNSPESKRLIFTSLPEAFLTYVKLALISGFFFSFPIIVWQMYRFIAPALYKKEKKSVIPFLIAAPCLFYAGAALAYFYIFPKAWEFFVSFEIINTPSKNSLPIELEAKLSEYLSLISGIIIAFGISFQLPLILLLLIKAKIIDVKFLIKSRKYAVIILLIFAAILTPPDIISQIGLFIALYSLYEATILIGIFMTKNKNKL